MKSSTSEVGVPSKLRIYLLQNSYSDHRSFDSVNSCLSCLSIRARRCERIKSSVYVLERERVHLTRSLQVG